MPENEILNRMDAATEPWILVLEDDEDDLTLTMRALKRVAEEVPVRVVTDGEEALEILKSNDLPTLVLMDAHMPKVSGIDLLHRVKKDARLGSIPFVVFSSSIGPNEMKVLMNEGATEIVLKPLDFTDYTDSIRRVIDEFVK